MLDVEEIHQLYLLQTMGLSPLFSISYNKIMHTSLGRELLYSKKRVS